MVSVSCVVHWFLFCHYTLQIGGFMFYEDVCTGDGQVKHINALLMQHIMLELSSTFSPPPPPLILLVPTNTPVVITLSLFPSFFVGCVVSWPLHGLASPQHSSDQHASHLTHQQHIPFLTHLTCRTVQLSSVGWNCKWGLLRIPARPALRSASHGLGTLFVCGTDVHQVAAEEWYTEALVLIWHENNPWL